MITYSFQLIDIDFVDSLDIIKKSKSRYILNIVCYFNRFVISFATKKDNVEDVL